MTYEPRFTWWDFAKLAYAVGVLAWVALDWRSYLAFCAALSTILFGVVGWMTQTASPAFVWAAREYMDLWR